MVAGEALPAGRQFADTGEVVFLLDVHPSTVRRWSDGKLLKRHRVGPRADRRYFWEDIAIFIGKRRGLISSRGWP